jgi:hypothetical protein
MGFPEDEAVLVGDLLKEIYPPARLIEFTRAPDGPWYSLRVEIAGVVAKDLVLPKSLVLAARTDPKALRTLGNIVRAEITMQRSREVIDRSREVLAGIERDPICPHCLTSIRPGAPVRFEHGEVFHIRCET